MHWHHGHHSRQRLTTALGELVYDRRVAYAHLRTFRDVYRLLDDVAGATPQSARAMIHRMRRRVSRMLAAVTAAIAGQPYVPTHPGTAHGRPRVAAASRPAPYQHDGGRTRVASGPARGQRPRQPPGGLRRLPPHSQTPRRLPCVDSAL